MAEQFTPGPWRISFSMSHGTNIYPENSPVSLASVVSLEDAHLIAASPALYAAVEALIECFIKRGPFDEPLGSSEQAPSINAGIAALAKARGESA